MKSKRTLDFIATMRQHGIKEAVAREILSLWDDREGEQATKADIDQLRQEGRKDIERLEASIEQLREGQKEQREQSKKDIEQVEKRLDASIEQLKEGQKRLEEGQREQRKGNRWAIGLLATAIIGGLTLLGIIITYQNSDMRADIRQLLQIHLNEQQAERTGNSAKPAQEGRVSAADQRGS